MKTTLSPQISFGNLTRKQMLKTVEKEIQSFRMNNHLSPEELLALLLGNDSFTMSQKLSNVGREKLREHAKSLDLPEKVPFENIVRKMFCSLFAK